jgi:soluble lytic murein transglycosylase-like protein
MNFLRDDEYAPQFTNPAQAPDSQPIDSGISAGSGGALPDGIGVLITEAARQYDLEPALLAGLLYQESRFDPRAKSPAGALGIAQLMPGTAKELRVSDPFDPSQAIFGGAEYLRKQINSFDGDVEKGLAAYNYGPGNMQKVLKNARGDAWKQMIPKETRDYIQKVPAHAERYRNVFVEAMEEAPLVWSLEVTLA